MNYLFFYIFFWERGFVFIFIFIFSIQPYKSQQMVKPRRIINYGLSSETFDGMYTELGPSNLL